MKPIQPRSESFRKRADPAAFWEAWVGATLTRAGLYVLLNPWKIEDSKDFSLSWDLNVGTSQKSAGDPLHHNILDVKSRSLTFHNVDSYPFEEVFICSQSNYLKKYPKPSTKLRHNFMIVSSVTGSMVWAPEGSPVEMNGVYHDRQRNEVIKSVQIHRDSLRPLQDYVDYLEAHPYEQGAKMDEYFRKKDYNSWDRIDIV